MRATAPAAVPMAAWETAAAVMETAARVGVAMEVAGWVMAGSSRPWGWRRRW